MYRQQVPEDLAKIREAELEFESKMADKSRCFCIEAADKQDAT
jgi:hypothetical protein